MNVVIACNTHARAGTLPEAIEHHIQQNVFQHDDYLVEFGKALRAGTGHGTMDVEADHYFSGSIVQMKPDIVFNLASGFQGPYREAYVPTCLENLGVPYTGADPLTASICQDKHSTKALLRAGRVPVPRALYVTSVEDVAARPMDQGQFPVILKPNNWGRSVGIHQQSVLDNQGDLIMLAQELLEEGLGPLIAEEYIPGREITLSLLGEHILRPIEFNPEALGSGLRVLDQSSKNLLRTIDDYAEGVFTPAEFYNQRLAENIEGVGLQVVNQLNLRDWATIDICLGQDNVPYVIDVNPTPDLIPDAILQTPMGAAIMAGGLSFEMAVQFVLDSAIARAGVVGERPVEPEQLGLGLGQDGDHQ